MEDRLVQLLKSEGINPTRFAERIGVQRSSMSHILSGRNKPSYDFIVKILESFPAVNPDWLLRGKGLMYKSDIPVQPGLFDVLKPQIAKSVEADSKDSFAGIRDEQSAIYQKSDIIHSSDFGKSESVDVTKSKSIEKIVVFYSDKTFSDYKPNT